MKKKSKKLFIFAYPIISNISHVHSREFLTFVLRLSRFSWRARCFSRARFEPDHMSGHVCSLPVLLSLFVERKICQAGRNQKEIFVEPVNDEFSDEAFPIWNSQVSSHIEGPPEWQDLDSTTSLRVLPLFNLYFCSFICFLI